MPTTIRLILWPSILTFVVSVIRLLLQLDGQVSAASGGSGAAVGITWLVFLFGGWFGWRLMRSGEVPGRPRAWLWMLLAFGLLFGAIPLAFGSLDPDLQGDAAYDALRIRVAAITVVAIAAAIFTFKVWRRLAGTLLLYALIARVTVVLIAVLCKLQGWDTHYTKFGPQGLEREFADTVISAVLSQLGFWVCFTIVGGTLAGSVIGAVTRAPSAETGNRG